MEEKSFSVKVLLAAALVSLLFVLLLFLRSYLFNKTRIVFCDVGQGDGTYIRTKEGIDILIDAGPSHDIAACVGKYMPFYDKTIELAFLSHPQKDHYGGYLSILNRYQIERFITTPVDNDNKSFNELKKKLQEKAIPIDNLYQGDRIDLSTNSSIHFLWPTKQFILTNSNKQPLAQKNEDSQVLGAYTAIVDLNDFSEIFTFSEGDFDLLFTGDAGPTVLHQIQTNSVLIEKTNQRHVCNKNNCLSYPDSLEILKVPHHGSKNGLSSEFLQLAEPMLSVISVGKKNSYGHPSKSVIDMFESGNFPYKATKDEGDIVVVIDGEGWRVKN